MHPKARIERYSAYALGPGHYMPDYNDGNAHREADFSRFVYWNNTLGASLDASGAFTFFTSDTDGRYRIVLQGLTREGKPFSAMAFFEVSGTF